ncbi:unnamed protein product, partial [Allacma fusca]
NRIYPLRISYNLENSRLTAHKHVPVGFDKHTCEKNTSP